jgi:hypothetical protein
MTAQMSTNSVVPPPPNTNEQPFEIGSTLTVFEAAMIYAGRHPHVRFLKDGEVVDYIDFLRARLPSQPQSKRAPRARRSWDILCVLIDRITKGSLFPARSAYLPTREIDPVLTRIQVIDLVALARERGERPKYLRPLFTIASSAVSEMPLRQKSRPARDRVQLAFAEIYPNGIPDSATEPNVVVCKEVGNWLKERGRLGVSDASILRAANRRR